MNDFDRLVLAVGSNITEEQLYELLAPWVDLHGRAGVARLLSTYADRLENSMDGDDREKDRERGVDAVLYRNAIEALEVGDDMG